MINLSGDLVFLKASGELDLAFDLSLGNVCNYLNSIKTTRDVARNARIYSDIMNDVHGRFFNVEQLLQKWLCICLEGTGGGRKKNLAVGEIIPDAICERSYIPRSYFIAFTKLFFIVLHKEKAILLPYVFSRPGPGWFNQIEAKFEIWVDTIKPFRELELTRQTALTLDGGTALESAGDTNDSEDELSDVDSRRHRRLIQCSSKLLLATDWYTIKSINVDEIEDLRCKILSKEFFITTPLPLLQIIEFLDDCFPGQLSEPLQLWVKSQGEESVRRFESSLQSNILRVLKSNSNPVQMVSRIISEGHVPLTEFANDKIVQWDIVRSVKLACDVDIGKPYEVWLGCQQYFFDTKHLEETKPYRTALGRLNVWLFLYLPAWIASSNSTTFKYPSAPNEFTGRFHYDCSHSPDGRPLSFVEFFNAMGWVYNYGSAVNYRVFFESLQDSHDLPGCEDLKQPVHKRPPSKKYDAVTKNVFPGSILLFYVEYLYAIERVSDYLFENSARLYKAFMRGGFFSFESLGYVPFFYWEGECYFVKDVSRTLLSFTEVSGKHYYNPGLIRFVILLLEVGPRGQAAQWLDSRTYDRLADRISSHPLHLTTLCLNTDKVHSTPLFVVTINRAIWLLDAQRSWRNNMYQNCGANAFQDAMHYDRRSHSKWEQIVPLFSYNGDTGEPFSDRAYSKFWAHCCLSFQCFLRSYEVSDIQLVALMPVSRVGSPIDWEKWVAGKVSVSKLKVNPPVSAQGTIYVGDHSPLSLRAKVTPHGARASFVTDMSTLLTPEDVAALTGQSAGQVIKYNKNNSLHKNLQGAYNWRDVRGQLSRATEQYPRMSEMVHELEGLRGKKNFLEVASEKGWVTSASGPFKKAMELIATDKNKVFGVSDTHVCVLRFECSKEVIQEVGYRNCSYCPLAIFSVSNIVAVAAQRTMSYDNYQTLAEEVLRRPSNWSDAEKLNDSKLLQAAGREAIGWNVVETNLWAMIQSSRMEGGQNLLMGDEDSVMHSIQRYQVEKNSPEDFFDRLTNATVYRSLVSEDFKFKMDRATRLLMAGDGKVHEALLAPFGFSSAEVLAAQFRNLTDFDNFDLEYYVRLVSMSNKEWAETLVQHYPSTSVFLGFSGVAKIDK